MEGRSRHQSDARLAQRSWVSLIEDIDVLAVDQALADRARDLAATCTVLGMDAVDLAVAAQLAEANSTGLLSFDVRQRSALNPGKQVAGGGAGGHRVAIGRIIVRVP